ncbi:hypothetical protein GGS21DRAFT_289376 [Xylaria nigripes]|nr:hypothetical protein GGS21DRAFT_289376 [Xylaria nigripes]
MFGFFKKKDSTKPKPEPNARSNAGLQGYAYIILQVIRFCNVAALLAVMVASVLMLIFAKLPNGFQFFADVIHGVVFFCAALLMFTEIGAWGKGQAFIASAWPMLGPDRGFSGLGVVMVVIGCHLLGGLSSGTYTAADVPSQIPQVIIGSGIINVAFGVTNIFASLMFRGEKVRAREVRHAGATTRNYTFNDNISTRSNSARKAQISGPMPIQDDYLPNANPVSYDDDKSSFDDRNSPIVPGVSRPDTALHPMNRRISHYSETSHIDRFGNPMV